MCAAVTTDVQWASVEEQANGSLLLKCGFAEGSLARGCQITIHLSLSGSVRIILRIMKAERSLEASKLYEGAIDWGVGAYLLATDIERDGETALVEVEGEIYLLSIVSRG